MLAHAPPLHVHRYGLAVDAQPAGAPSGPAPSADVVAPSVLRARRRMSPSPEPRTSPEAGRGVSGGGASATTELSPSRRGSDAGSDPATPSRERRGSRCVHGAPAASVAVLRGTGWEPAVGAWLSGARREEGGGQWSINGVPDRRRSRGGAAKRCRGRVVGVAASVSCAGGAALPFVGSKRRRCRHAGETRATDTVAQQVTPRRHRRLLCTALVVSWLLACVPWMWGCRTGSVRAASGRAKSEGGPKQPSRLGKREVGAWACGHGPAHCSCSTTGPRGGNLCSPSAHTRTVQPLASCEPPALPLGGLGEEVCSSQSRSRPRSCLPACPACPTSRPAACNSDAPPATCPCPC